VVSSCEHGNEPSGHIKCWEFHEWLSHCWLLTDLAPWTSLFFFSRVVIINTLNAKYMGRLTLEMFISGDRQILLHVSSANHEAVRILLGGPNNRHNKFISYIG
jgi:hypothetical protein